MSAWRQWWHLEAPLLGGDAAVTTDATAPQNMRAILSKVGALLAPDRATMVAAVAFMLVRLVQLLLGRLLLPWPDRVLSTLLLGPGATLAHAWHPRQDI